MTDPIQPIPADHLVRLLRHMSARELYETEADSAAAVDANERWLAGLSDGERHALADWHDGVKADLEALLRGER